MRAVYGKGLMSTSELRGHSWLVLESLRQDGCMEATISLAFKTSTGKWMRRQQLHPRFLTGSVVLQNELRQLICNTTDHHTGGALSLHRGHNSDEDQTKNHSHKHKIQLRRKI